MWIAFKLYFYIGLWQLALVRVSIWLRCELLSNCIFISVFDNSTNSAHLYYSVVNCFQIVFLYRSLTTFLPMFYDMFLLWIAFKLYFYIGLWQQDGNPVFLPGCCELLSNCIFISVFDNRSSYGDWLGCVVNCFQIVFLYRSLTT